MVPKKFGELFWQKESKLYTKDPLRGLSYDRVAAWFGEIGVVCSEGLRDEPIVLLEGVGGHY